MRREIKFVFLILLCVFLFIGTAFYLGSQISRHVVKTPQLKMIAGVTTEGDGLLFYAASANTTPQYRTYSVASNDFSANSGTVVGAQPAINQIKTSPTKQEAIAGYQDTSGNLRVLCYDGTNWSQDWTVAVAASGTPTTRRFDIAYETTTGDVTVAYSRNTAAVNALAYRTKAGSTGCGTANWAVAANFPTTTTATSATVMWVKAARDGRSAQNLSAWVWLDNAATNADLGGAIWSGSAFTNFKQIETSMEHQTAVGDSDNFDVQAESLSGEYMVVWGNSAGASGTNGYRYMTCTGGTSACTWSALLTMPTTLDEVMAIDLSADPLTNKMSMVGVGGVSFDMSAGYWDGTGPWIGYANVDITTETTVAVGSKKITTGWLTNGANTKWYIAYDDATDTVITYKYAINGGAFSSATYTCAPALNDLRGRFDTDINPFNNAELIMTISDSTNGIFAYRLSMDAAGALSWSNMTTAVSLGTKPSHPQQGFSFTYWRFIPIPTISIAGTCYQYDQATPCADAGAEVIAVAVNGVLQAQTDGTVDASWEITGITQPAADATITVFVNGEATASERATAVTKYNSGGTGNIGGIVLYQRHLTIGSDQNTTVSNADMDDYDYNAGADADDSDIIYDIDASFNLTVDNLGSYSDERLLVLASNTYQPDSGDSGNVTTHDIINNGTITADGNTFYISGSWDNNAVFTALASTVIFTSTVATTETVDPVGSGASSFNNATFGNAASATTWTLSSALDINGDLTVSYGTLSMNGNHQINLAGALLINNSGNYTKDNTATAKFIFDGGAGKNLTSRGQDMGNIQLSTGSTNISLQDALDVDDITIDTNTTLAGNSQAITCGGNWANSGIFTHNNGTVEFNGDTADQTITTNGQAFYDVTVNGAGAGSVTKTFRPEGDDYVGLNGIYPASPTTHFDKVAETSADSDSTYVEYSGPGPDEDFFTKGANTIPAGSTINSVKVYYTAKYYDDALEGLYASTRSLLYVNATSHYGALKENDVDLTTSYQEFSDTWTDNPDTLEAFTVDDITGLEFGVECNGGNYADSGRVTQIYLVVDYTASSSVATWTLQDALTVANNLTIISGTLIAGNNNIITVNYAQDGGTFSAPTPDNGKQMTVIGDWNMNTDTENFLHNDGTVVFAGTAQSIISGSTTFYNLTMNTTTDGAKTITFPTGIGNKQTIAGTWTLDGASGKVLITPATAWYFQIAAPFTAGDYINVTDSWSADTNKITPGANTTNGGNNNGWIFITNADPTNDALTFTNPYTSNVAISDDTTEWNFRALVTDTDGPTNIDYVELRFANSADSTQPYDSLKLRWTEATDTFSETADTQGSTTLTSTNANSNASGNQWTLDFKIKINNNFLAKDTQYAAELYTIDEVAASDTDNFTNKYQVTVLSISLDVDNPTLSFGNLLPGSIVTGTTIATVTTNYPNGYALGASDGVAGTDSTLLHTDTVTRIADYAGTIAVPTVWSGTGLGITIWAGDTPPAAKWCADICSSEVDPDNKYAGVPETVDTIHAKTGSPTSGDDTSVGYKLVVPNTQKTGDYQGDITYTATGTLL